MTILLDGPESLLLGTLFGRDDHKARKEELVALLAAGETGYSAHRLEALVSRLRAKVPGRCGLKLPLVSDYGKGYAFMEHARLL